VSVEAQRSLQPRRVKKAYEQVVDQLLVMFADGTISVGERLPSEASLGRDFGVSRATIREALRVLTTQNLIRTVKGPSGGSYVTLPTIDHISSFVHSNISLLTTARDLSLDEFLEARSIFEGAAAAFAATRRTDADIQRLRDAAPGDLVLSPTRERLSFDKSFHSLVVEISRNGLLAIATQPIFMLLETHVSRLDWDRSFYETVADQHLSIIEAIAEGDAPAAEAEMRAHLDFLRPAYERGWRHREPAEG
jgi:DNA-binding FadR family transcriptional regulator